TRAQREMSGAVAGGAGAFYRGAPATGGYQGAPYAATNGATYGGPYNGMGGGRGPTGAARLTHSHSFSSATSPRPDAPLSSTNLYIRGLAPNTTDDELRRMCEEFGKITSTKAIMDKMTNTCKGYGFVDFESAEGASAAVDGLLARGVQAQMAKARNAPHVSGSSPFGVEQDPTNLYIANLPLGYNETQLEAALQEYGMVISTRILRNGEGTSRGVGFARMDNRDKCEDIIRALNGTVLPGSPEGTAPLLVKLADSGHRKKRPPMGMGMMGNPMLDYSGHGFPSSDLYGRGGMNSMGYMMHPYMMHAAQHQYNGYAFDSMTSQMNALSMGGAGAGGRGEGAGGPPNGGGADSAPANGHPMYHQANYGYPAAAAANPYYSNAMDGAAAAGAAGSYAAAASNHYGGGAAANGGYGGQHNGGEHEPIGTFQASTGNGGGANGRPKY
ncbi:hypothetical protein PFISCL1PPCAC_11076, partial [Pristionchus fissidentatus]